jgi:uncharacterized membrane protein YphA (DoxX/SURF4 family)
MLFSFEERLSDSPFVERIWRTHSEHAGAFTSLAAADWEMVVMRHNGKMNLTVRGPETRATPVYCAVQAEWFGIIFTLGSFMPHLLASDLVDAEEQTTMSIVHWILQVLLAAQFLWHGWLMVAPPAELIAIMDAQFAPWFRIFVGVAESLGAIGLILPGITRILPWLTPLAATGLMIVAGSATSMHLFRGETGSGGPRRRR